LKTKGKHRKPLPSGWRRWIRPEAYDFEPSTPAMRLAKKAMVTTVGFSVVLIGIVMIATPGPAVVVIPAGLAILAIEFAWARRWLRRLKACTRLAKRRTRRRLKTPPPR
jgi:tellurite resistance protein TerC